MTELSGIVGGRFEIDCLAGAGGMGAVYRAWDRPTGAIVALKVLHPHRANYGERFEREAATLSQLDFPGIVRLVAFGRTDEGQPYLAMEWLAGESLAERLARQLLTVDEALGVGALVADSLGAAHALGVVHRDLKPSNIFLVDGLLDHVKLLDFGMARLIDPNIEKLTRTGVLLGTPAFMAPEQVRAAKAVGPPADVYALGCVLFECLAGRPVFLHDDPTALAMSALMDTPPRLASLCPAVPPELDALVAQLLAKRPAERPSDGGAAAHALRVIAQARQSSSSIGTAETIAAPSGAATAANIGTAETIAAPSGAATAASIGTAETIAAPSGAAAVVGQSASPPIPDEPGVALPPTAAAWSPSAGTGPAVAAEAYGTDLQPALGQPRAAASRPSRVQLAVGLGSLVLTLAVVAAGGWFWLTPSAGGPRRSASRNKDWTPGPGSPFADEKSCPFERCAPFKVKRPKRFEPVDALGEVTRFVRRTVPQAVFAGIVIHEAVGGAVDLTAKGVVQYFFLTSKASDAKTIIVKVAHGSLMLETTDEVVSIAKAPIPPPTCRLADAWKAAEPHGLKRNARLSAQYYDAGAIVPQLGLTVAWMLSGDDEDNPQYWRLDGKTCAFQDGIAIPFP